MGEGKREEKEEQIKKILQDEGLTFGMALSIIRRVEADILLPFRNCVPSKSKPINMQKEGVIPMSFS